MRNGSNGLGIAGFILSLLALFLGWIPVLGWILWGLGLLFSFIGLFKAPRGFAFAGFLLALVDLIAFLFLFSLLGLVALI